MILIQLYHILHFAKHYCFATGIYTIFLRPHTLLHFVHFLSTYDFFSWFYFLTLEFWSTHETFFFFLQNSLTKRSKYKSIMKWVRLLQLFAEFNFILPDYYLQDYIKIFLFHTWMISKGNPIVFQAEPGLEQFIYHVLINPVIWIHTSRLFAI